MRRTDGDGEGREVFPSWTSPVRIRAAAPNTQVVTGGTRNPFAVSSDQAVSGPRGDPSPGYVLAFTSCSAHAFANPKFGDLSPRGVAQPPSSTNCRCFHESIFWNAASFAAALGCCMKLATQ